MRWQRMHCVSGTDAFQHNEARVEDAVSAPSVRTGVWTLADKEIEACRVRPLYCCCSKCMPVAKAAQSSPPPARYLPSSIRPRLAHALARLSNIHHPCLDRQPRTTCCRVSLVGSPSFPAGCARILCVETPSCKYPGLLPPAYLLALLDA